MSERNADPIEQIRYAIATLESQHRELGVDNSLAIAVLQERLVQAEVVLQSGPGATATTGGVAAGEGGVAVGGDVHGNIYMGPRPRDAAEALVTYRRMVMQEWRHLSLRGLDIGASDATRPQSSFDLTQVYVDLLTTKNLTIVTVGSQDKESEIRPWSALEAVIAHRRMVLLGDPGSGKSTFLSHLALCLAAHGLEPKKKWLDRLPGWPTQDANVLPIMVTLRDFAQWLPERPAKAEARQLWQSITERLQGQNLDFVTEPLREKLEHGEILLLNWLQVLQNEQNSVMLQT